MGGSAARSRRARPEDETEQDADGEDVKLGDKLRAQRIDKGLALADLAGAAGVSVGWLSQVERGLSSPSIRALRKLCAALAIPVSQLFDQEGRQQNDDHGVIVRANARRRLNFSHKGMAKELITPDESGALQVMDVLLGPGGGSGEQAYSHEGEEAGIVLAGILELTVDSRPYRLAPGDAFRFESTRLHKFRNLDHGQTRVIWIVTPPLY